MSCEINVLPVSAVDFKAKELLSQWRDCIDVEIKALVGGELSIKKIGSDVHEDNAVLEVGDGYLISSDLGFECVVWLHPNSVIEYTDAYFDEYSSNVEVGERKALEQYLLTDSFHCSLESLCKTPDEALFFVLVASVVAKMLGGYVIMIDNWPFNLEVGTYKPEKTLLGSELINGNSW